MRRHLLPLATLGLLLLVLADRVVGSPAPAPAGQRAGGQRNPERHPGSSTGGRPGRRHARRSNEVAAGEARRARLAAREALSREAGSTYLDSLILSTDSVVRRWPDRWGAPIRVALIEGGRRPTGPRGWRATCGRRSSGGRDWASGSGSRWSRIPARPTSWCAGSITSTSIGRARPISPGISPAGSVARWSRSRSAPTPASSLPDDALLSVAVHETGHAIGLPHSCGLQRRHVPRHPDRHALRSGPPHGGRALPSAARPGAGDRRTSRGSRIHPSNHIDGEVRLPPGTIVAGVSGSSWV